MRAIASASELPGPRPNSMPRQRAPNSEICERGCVLRHIATLHMRANQRTRLQHITPAPRLLCGRAHCRCAQCLADYERERACIHSECDSPGRLMRTILPAQHQARSGGGLQGPRGAASVSAQDDVQAVAREMLPYVRRLSPTSIRVMASDLELAPAHSDDGAVRPEGPHRHSHKAPIASVRARPPATHAAAGDASRAQPSANDMLERMRLRRPQRPVLRSVDRAASASRGVGEPIASAPRRSSAPASPSGLASMRPRPRPLPPLSVPAAPVSAPKPRLLHGSLSGSPSFDRPWSPPPLRRPADARRAQAELLRTPAEAYIHACLRPPLPRRSAPTELCAVKGRSAALPSIAPTAARGGPL